MKFLNYVQSTPATSWTITHNFGQKVAADTWVTVAGHQTKILPKKITNVDNNTLLIEFATARAGGARLVASPYSYPAIGGDVGGDIGTFDMANSSFAPPSGQTYTVMNPPTMDGTYSVGSWNASDEFNANNGNLNGRTPTTYTPPPSNSSRSIVWSGDSTSTPSTVSAGALLLSSANTDSAFPALNDAGEFSNPNGIFIEFKYYATSIDTSLIVGFNLGATNISIVANENPGTGNAIRIDASGLNGFTKANGDLLDADPTDTAFPYSKSYTLDRYYSTPLDGRGKVLRAELTPTSFRLMVDGAVVLRQTPRWNVKFFSTANGDSRYAVNVVGIQMFRSNTDSQTTVDYVRVGAL